MISRPCVTPVPLVSLRILGNLEFCFLSDRLSTDALLLQFLLQVSFVSCLAALGGSSMASCASGG